MITKVSEITEKEIQNYLRIEDISESDINYLKTIINVAINFILNYTGIENKTELDKYSDFVIVVYVLCQDMYDTRAYYVDNDNVNKVVMTILDMHVRNLLWRLKMRVNMTKK